MSEVAMPEYEWRAVVSKRGILFKWLYKAGRRKAGRRLEIKGVKNECPDGEAAAFLSWKCEGDT